MQRGRGRKGPEVDGALRSMKALKSLGYEVMIHTTRATNGQEGIDTVAGWLDKRGIPYDGITAEKLDAKYYIDDKAIAFKGRWSDVLNQIGR